MFRIFNWCIRLCFFYWLIGTNAYAQGGVSFPEPLQVRNGLPGFFKKLSNSQPLTIAYLGGSITEAAGYRVETEKYFKNTFPGSTIKTVNAGVGGTGAALGVFRLQDEVLKYRPDLVFVEFAVNDAETDSLLLCNAMEGIVRQIKKSDPKTDICFLYSVYEPMLKDLQAGKQVRSVRLMERLADHYKLPSINLSYDVIRKVNSGDLIFHGSPDVNYGAKTVFSTDGTHPGVEGHAIYTHTITKAFKQLIGMGKRGRIPTPLYLTNFDKTLILQPEVAAKTPGWIDAKSEKELQPYLKVYPELIYSADTRDSITIKFKGTYIGIGDILGPSAAGAVEIRVDDNEPIRRSRFDSYCWFYRRSFYLIGPLPNSAHTVSIKKADLDIDKAEIIGGHSSVFPNGSYQPSNAYIGNIMIIGKKN
ncbi:SGNH/GDSL hydrolase family protein [Desertivirga arenae]|uniref:SGNH/GDSL hydrolase family protein n=1 Tax=Desertivirga arenae TaxID=2810309 RepID=UPI001A96A575|nr:SGNH/GDSL hydrolase family protein [Pedobacter sp. SYSU D00823]